MADLKEQNISAVTSLAAADFFRTVASNGTTGKITAQNALLQMLDNCGLNLKNSIYRGASLGSSLTAAQASEISNGTFKNMWLGDYWTINSITWRIWGFDWHIGRGDTNTSKHHVVILPDQCLLVADGSTTHYMNDTNTTEGGYDGSKCRQVYLLDKTTSDYPYMKIANAFGASHILQHREIISTAVADGKASSWAWKDCNVELPTEAMMYGHGAWGDGRYNIGSEWGQLPLARIKPNFVANRTNYWLRDVVSASGFAVVGSAGYANSYGASNAWGGVRPFFLLS